MTTTVQNPYSFFTDRTGLPLDQGYIYIGTANADPEVAPADIFWDEGLTIPAGQPLRTENGYIVNGSSPSTVWTATDFSIRVRDKNHTQVFYAADSQGGSGGGGGNIGDGTYALISNWLTNDPDGEHVEANTTALTQAISDCTGQIRLYWPENFSAVINAFVIEHPIHLLFDGNWKMADDQNANVIDIQASDVTIRGKGTFDGNKIGQVGGVGTAVGGITANCTSGTAVMPLPPDPLIPISNIMIDGVTITNCFNWPVSIGLGGGSNVTVQNCVMSYSQNSPQFFINTQNGKFLFNVIHDITDGGLVFYHGNNGGCAIGNEIYNCNDGIGVFTEDSTLPMDQDILIIGNRMTDINDTGVGITTGGTSTPKQQRVIVANNHFIRCNGAGTDGRGAIGITNATDVIVHDNVIAYCGNTSASGSHTYGIFINDFADRVSIHDNFFQNMGSAVSHGHCIWLASAKGTSIFNNRAYDVGTPVTEALVAGTFGVRGAMGGNILLGPIAGHADEVFKQPDTQLLGSPTDLYNAQRFTGALELVDPANQNVQGPIIASVTGTPSGGSYPYGSIYMRRDASTPFGTLYAGASGGVVPILTGMAITADWATGTVGTADSILTVATPAGLYIVPGRKIG